MDDRVNEAIASISGEEGQPAHPRLPSRFNLGISFASTWPGDISYALMRPACVERDIICELS